MKNTDKPADIVLNNQKVKYHNLGGRPNDYGQVSIDVSFEISDELYEQLQRDGYHVSQYTPKINGEVDPDAEPINLFKGMITFRDKTGQLKPRHQRPEILMVMEGEDNGVYMTESMLENYFGGARPKVEILYADEVEISAANKPRKDGDGHTAYINAMVIVCKKKSKYGVKAAAYDDEE